MSLTLAMTAGNDNQLILLAKVGFDSGVVKYASKSITLSSNLWSDGYISWDSFPAEISNNINVVSGGGFADMPVFNFAIDSSSGITKEVFFPAVISSVTQEYIMGRPIELGFVWEGATAETEITWFYSGVIIDYGYYPNRIVLTCTDSFYLDNVMLPYYEIQKELDNGKSYFADAPYENYGLPIPILYGNFNIVSFEFRLFRLTPAICINQNQMAFAFASHACFDDSRTLSGGTMGVFNYSGNELFQYLDGLDTYMALSPSAGGVYYSSDRIAFNYLYPGSRTAGDKINGAFIAVPLGIGSQSDISNITNLVDKEDGASTSISLADGEVVSVIFDKFQNSNVWGLFGKLANDIYITADWESDDGSKREITINYYNPSSSGLSSAVISETTSASKTTTLGFGNVTTVKADTDLPWRWDELSQLEFVLTNTSGSGASSGAINVFRVYVGFDNIWLSGVFK